MSSRYQDLLDRIRTGLLPLRELAGKFAIPPAERDTIIGKAATFVVCEGIEGDYLEFGVYRGESLAQAYRAIRSAYAKEIATTRDSDPRRSSDRARKWASMRFFAFDSFEGLPELRGPDALTGDFRPGQFRTSVDDFWAHLKKRKVDLSRVVAVKGWFQDTLVEDTRRLHHMEKAAIVHIDSDLYESARLALDFVTPLLQDGTVLIFDDWYNYRAHPALGERRALAEWSARNPRWGLTEYHKEGVRRNSFIVNDMELHPEAVGT